MEIPAKPAGLLRRRHFHVDQGRVVVEETWDIDTPGCPMVRNPWAINRLQLQGSIFVRQIEMTEEEFARTKPPMFG